MEHELTSDELTALIRRVFEPQTSDRNLAIIIDMPDDNTPDHPAWKERREMASDWAKLLAPLTKDCNLDKVSLVLYRNAKANNADLPASAIFHTDSALPDNADGMTGSEVSFESIFQNYQLLIAPTEFSATAPLKMAAKKFGFRAATMPGFDRTMIPALKLDYGIVGRRVDMFKKMLDEATGCVIDFDVQGTRHTLNLDLRHRLAHASGGIFKEPGIAGNLPSGEAYIVPYEGEVGGDSSLSNGEIPVQFDDDVVVYKIKENKAVEVLSDNGASTKEKEHLQAEPAYGNLAELGLGVLGDFGLEPTGEILLDEKLGMHIAFGRSEHFGGQVGPADFSAPDKVVHIDRVYIPKLQPKVSVKKATLQFSGSKKVLLMKDGIYQVDL